MRYDSNERSKKERRRIDFIRKVFSTRVKGFLFQSFVGAGVFCRKKAERNRRKEKGGGNSKGKKKEMTQVWPRFRMFARGGSSSESFKAPAADFTTWKKRGGGSMGEGPS